ncbi:hypothetical protein B0H12DRAFT_1237112 [Mycena haematopus]|nr:hypothetical protein B0H12DRAFT_1237112 [Mycena haematopus]
MQELSHARLGIGRNVRGVMDVGACAGVDTPPPPSIIVQNVRVSRRTLALPACPIWCDLLSGARVVEVGRGPRVDTDTSCLGGERQSHPPHTSWWKDDGLMIPTDAMERGIVRVSLSGAWFGEDETLSLPYSPQPGHPLPELPPELWITILEYSTYPSSPSLDSPSPICELPDSFLSPALTPASLAPRLASYRAAMRHKRTLALVSKQWYQYAQPVLYASIWIARSAQAKALVLTLLCQASCLDPASAPPTRTSAGRFIRRLHIETPALERCNPADLCAILDYAPRLEVYSDYRSVRRFANAEKGGKGRVSAVADLLRALAQGGGLRALSWTNYDDPALVGLGVGLGMALGLKAAHMGARLEYLELNFVSSAVSPSVRTALATKAKEGAFASGALVLPALRTLKVALDNATFAVLSTWDMPALRKLSVLSADFSYAGEGFRRFFTLYGPRLWQLELGHSSAHIEEHYLTAPPAALGTGAGGGGGDGGGGIHRLSLAEWCPHLEEFVCSADAAWDWQYPDWIPPHLLLPAHPTVSLIGIRGIDARLWDDYARADHNAGGDDTPFSGLRAQVESLLRREAFPRLQHVRDLSEGSDAMRRGHVGLRPRAHADGNIGGAETEAREGEGNDMREREWVAQFWEGVLRRCGDEGVWLEDWRGRNVTSGSLRWARVMLRAGNGDM